MCATLPTVLFEFFSNFTGVLTMLLRYACGLDIILSLILSPFRNLNLVVFQPMTLRKTRGLDICYSQIIFV